jgi:murein DD-endopeptidase MepM/ murein hydrolase activator NlpD
MPRVPVYNAPQVNVNQQPNGQFQGANLPAPVTNMPGPTNVNPGALAGAGNLPIPNGAQSQGVNPINQPTPASTNLNGALLGARQGEQLGNAVQGAGSRLADIMSDAQSQVNAVRADDALNKVKEYALKLQFDPDTGFTSAKGINALERQSGKPLAVEYSEQLKEFIAKTSEGLGNDAQRRTFGLGSNNLATQFESAAMQHENNEFKTYSLSVSEGSIKNSLDSIEKNWQNPELINQSMVSLTAQVGHVAKLTGKSATWVEAKVREAASNAHKIVIQQAILNNNLPYAQAYMDRNKDFMSGNDLLAVQKVLKGESETQIAVNTAASTFRDNRPANTPVERLVNILKPYELADSAQNGTPFVQPLAGLAKVSSGYGSRNDPHGGGVHQHGGIDYATPVGTPVQAAAAGTVVKVGDDGNKGYGKYVEIKHNDGSITKYAHLSEINVAKGATVAQGGVFAASGNTGKSTGPHLHFEVRGPDGKLVDPSSVMPGGGTVGATLEANLKKYGREDMAVAATVVGGDQIAEAIKEYHAVPGNKGKPVSFAAISPYLDVNGVETIQKVLTAYEKGEGTRQSPTLLELQNNALMRLGPNASRLMRAQTLEEVTRLYDTDKKATAQREAEQMAMVQDALVKNGGNYNALSPQLRSMLKPAQVDEAMAFADKIARGPDYSNPTVLNTYLNNPDALRGKTQEQLDRIKVDLSKKDAEAIQSQWAAANGRAKGSVDVNTSYIKSRLDLLLPQMKIDPKNKDDAAKVALIQVLVNDVVAGQQAQTGKQLNEVQLNSVINDVLRKQVVASGWFSDSNKPLMQFKYGDIPSKDIKRIEAEYKDKGLKVPDNQTVLYIFMQDKLNIKRDGN